MVEKMNQNEKNNTQSKTNESNLETIIVVGQCNGTYANDKVTKEFGGKVLVTARPDGAVIVHNLSAGVRPVCYIDGGAEISLARNVADAEIELLATTEDGQQLTMAFTDVIAIQGVPADTQTQSLAMSALKCVFDLGGRYGRTTIARVLTGSVSKKVLTINISKLGTYGVAKGASMKEVLTLIDWLVEEGYIAYAEETEFPVLVITSKGLDVLADGGEIPNPAVDTDPKETEHRFELLRDWRDRKSKEMGKPKYFVLLNRTMRELASRAPGTVDDLTTFYGIGETKAQQYGEEILSLL
jgi:superfamily II DNA helicase RecQ